MNDEIAERMVLALQDIVRATTQLAGGAIGSTSVAPNAVTDGGGGEGSGAAATGRAATPSVSSAVGGIGKDIMAGEGVQGASVQMLAVAVTTAVTKALASSFAQGTADQWGERKARPQELLRAYAAESGRAGIIRSKEELQKFHDLNTSLGRKSAENLTSAMQIAGHGPDWWHKLSGASGGALVDLANKLKSWTSANAQIHDASKAEGK